MKRTNIMRLKGFLAISMLTAGMLIFLSQSTPQVRNAPILGIVIAPAEDDWKESLLLSIEAEATANGMELMTLPTERTLEQQAAQISALRALLVYGADAIVFFPTVESGWDNIIEEAEQAGVPIIAVDKAIRPGRNGKGTYYVGYDYNGMAEETTRILIQRLAQNPGAILELCGTTSSYPAKEISRGFRQTLAKDGRFSITYSYCGEYMRSYGREITSAVISRDPNLKAIISHNDAMALGAIDAIRQSGFTPGKDIMLYAFGGGEDTLRLFHDGEIEGLVRRDTTSIGAKTIDTVLALLAKESPHADDELSETELLVQGVTP